MIKVPFYKIIIILLFFICGYSTSSYAQSLQYESMRVAKIDLIPENLPEGSVFDYNLVRTRLQTKVGNLFSQSEFDQDLKFLAENGHRWEAAKVNFVALKDESAYCFFQFLKAPFFSVAFLFAALYTILDPFNGRKLVAGIELGWNSGIDIDDDRAFAPTLGKIGEFQLVGRNAFYLPGCFQPVAYAKLQEGTQLENHNWVLVDIDGQEYKLNDRHFQIIKDAESCFLPECCDRRPNLIANLNKA